MHDASLNLSIYFNKQYLGKSLSKSQGIKSLIIPQISETTDGVHSIALWVVLGEEGNFESMEWLAFHVYHCNSAPRQLCDGSLEWDTSEWLTLPQKHM